MCKICFTAIGNHLIYISVYITIHFTVKDEQTGNSDATDFCFVPKGEKRRNTLCISGYPHNRALQKNKQSQVSELHRVYHGKG